MTLQAGTRSGPYEILSPLGAGGMGDPPSLLLRQRFRLRERFGGRVGGLWRTSGDI